MITKLEYIKRIWDEKAVIVQRDPITLKSGRESYVYLNHRNFICLSENMDIILSLLEANLSKVSNKPFALSNVTSSLSPILVGALSLRTKIPFYFYRPISSEKGLFQDIFTYDFNPSSRFPKRLPAVLIDDVVTTTTTLKITTESLQNAGIDVMGSVILMDRRIKSEKENPPIKIFSIVSLAEILEFGINNLNLDKEKIKLLEIEIEDLQK